MENEVMVRRIHRMKCRVGCNVNGSEAPMEIFESTEKPVYIYIHIFICISFLEGYLVHQISHWQLSAFNVFRSQKQSLVLTNTNTK